MGPVIISYNLFKLRIILQWNIRFVPSCRQSGAESCTGDWFTRNNFVRSWLFIRHNDTYTTQPLLINLYFLPTQARSCLQLPPGLLHSCRISLKSCETRMLALRLDARWMIILLMRNQLACQSQIWPGPPYQSLQKYQFQMAASKTSSWSCMGNEFLWILEWLVSSQGHVARFSTS